MGQRGNYIIQQGKQVAIHYTHWRANLIASDLVVGPATFLDFVQQFDRREELVGYPWIEGCVYLNLDQQLLVFWEDEQLHPSSVRAAYLELLQKIWQGWEVRYARRQMYDIETLLGIDYTSTYSTSPDEPMSLEDLLKAEDNSYVCTNILLKKQGQISARNSKAAYAESLAYIGEGLVEYLLQLPPHPLPIEEEQDGELLVLDVDNKVLYFDDCTMGLQQALAPLWPGWQLEVGDFGYLPLVEKLGMTPSTLRPSDAYIEEGLQHIINIKDDFDPSKIAQRFAKDGEEAQFHPNFFENIKRPTTTWEKLQAFFKKK